MDSKFRIETKEVRGVGTISDITIVMGPNAYVFASLLNGQYRDIGLLEIEDCCSVKCGNRSCVRHFDIPLHLYRCSCDTDNDLLTRELRRLEEKPNALLVFDRVFDVMYPADVIEHAYMVAKLAEKGTRSIVITHHPFITDVFMNIDAVADYLKRERVHINSTVNMLTTTVTRGDYTLKPYGNVFLNFYARIYR